jgi:hypothetical protein
MKYFAALLKMKDLQKNTDYHDQHIAFLQQRECEGKIYARGRFADNKGGMAIYMAPSYEEAMKIAENDPYVQSGARTLELYEWDMKVVAGK